MGSSCCGPIRRYGPVVREAEVVDAFEAWLRGAGWAVDREVAFVDLRAEHPDGRLLYVEAKGHMTSPGLDVDTLYGQLLRRMKPEEAAARYAVVVPTSVLKAVQRVAPAVRETLRIDLFTVDDAGQVSPA